jgi:hypothetical protein
MSGKQIADELYKARLHHLANLTKQMTQKSEYDQIKAKKYVENMARKNSAHFLANSQTMIDRDVIVARAKWETAYLEQNSSFIECANLEKQFKVAMDVDFNEEPFDYGQLELHMSQPMTYAFGRDDGG